MRLYRLDAVKASRTSGTAVIAALAASTVRAGASTKYHV
jgi:hypothetical protein